MIDLAGSEKGCVTGNKGARFREGSNINKSLLGARFFQCCGSGIRCLFDNWIRDPGWVKIRMRIRDPDPE
jgi:hypothetical protein